MMSFDASEGMESEPSTSTYRSTVQWLQPCRKFKLHEVLSATENFNESLVIGSGGFGKVYKGKVIIGTSHVVAAIKRLDMKSDQGPAEFWAEVEMLSKLRHSHLVSLFGYCNYEREMILIYEYMPNGTLEDHLHKLHTCLSWVDRLKICIGAARGLDYLHTGTSIEFGVIHRDVKSSNILLDKSWEAKISDFGLSRISQRNQPRTYVNTLVKGTFGYLDPNYFATGKLTRKSDVYAFGVVLFEVLCRKRPLDRSLEYGLAALAQDSIKKGDLKSIVDSDIRGELSPKCLKGFARIAERCLAYHPKDRPTMNEVILSLESLLTLQLQTPGRSIFTRMVNAFPFNSTGENPGTRFGFFMVKKQKPLMLTEEFLEQNGGLLFKEPVMSFTSREKIFKAALGFLQQGDKAQVIALCGMGGVGKTTMMEQLKKAVEDKKMFDWVVKVVIGEKMNSFSIQQTVAEYLQIPLTETSTTARADRLRVTFGKISQERKEKVLVILDDVWEKVELKDVGLCPLPNNFKLLLTSRNENVCTHITAEDTLDLRVVRVDVMEESEANNFFFQISEVSNPELKEMGVKIVKRCGFLPLAIKLIATNLKSKEKSVWMDTLRRLKKKDLDENLRSSIEISYAFIAEEDAKAVFLLCGLFPDDFNIPIEDLTRYAWGLKLLNEVPTLGDARDRIKTCVLDLKNANLLIDSDRSECVKMHNLVLAFVVAKVSKGDHPWIVNHGDVSNWSRAEMSESCRRISLTCTGMSEFPRDFNYPNVSLLRLMNGNESLKFPDDFYEKMENLQVLACENFQYPLLPTSLQCSTTLQTLCLDECSLVFDCSPIGDHLLNLEVLSFAYSGIRYLPSAIGNLVKLRLLDLTGCMDLRIDEGVLKNLVKLEELYMTVDKDDLEFTNKSGVRFTDANYKELAERSKNLSALEVEFINNNPHSKNMSYNKLESFKISIGRFLERHDSVKDIYSSENILILKVAKKDELLESGINELFSKTEVLYLEAGSGMNNLEEVVPKSVPPQNLFYNLRVLCVSGCADLRYLFTVPVARGLVKLERLMIQQCPVMEALVYSEGNGEEEEGVDDIRFQGLTYLCLFDLPKLEGLSNTNNIVIHLPQLLELYLKGLPNFTSIYPQGEYKSATSSIMSSSSSTIDKPFFNKQAMIPPRLEILEIWRMEALKTIWAPCEQVVDATCCLLQKITVGSCDNLVNMFPRNPMPLLHHLETITVYSCDSIQVLFDIDIHVGCLGHEIKEGRISKLRSIIVRHSRKLTEVWRLKGGGGGVVNINHPDDDDDDVIICGCFQAVEEIEIKGCERFRNIFTPTTARFDLGALTDFSINGISQAVERNQEVSK